MGNIQTASNNISYLYTGMTRRICVLFGILVLLTELAKWKFSAEHHSIEFMLAISSIGIVSIVAGLCSGRLYSHRTGAWTCAALLLLFPLLEGIYAGGVDPMTLCFAVGFPVFYTLLLGPRQTLLGAAAGIFLIVFLSHYPIDSLQILALGEMLPQGSGILDQTGSLGGIIPVLICAAATYTLAHQNQAMQEKLNRDAVFDNLTGIPNRRAFDRQVIDEIERAQRVRTPLSMMVFDIDNFKMYNDLYGHQAGDRALQAVARAIDSVCVRSTDFVARYGGEEFVALLPATTDDRAELLAAKIRSNLKRMKDSPVEDHKITLSAGIAVLNGETRMTPEELFRRADEALYESKRSGKDCVTIYSSKKRPPLHSVK